MSLPRTGRFEHGEASCNSPEQFQYLRAIQGNSGGTHIDPTLQDNVLLPDDFAEHIYHAGSSHDLPSIIQSGLIPGEKSLRKDRHAVFFTAVNPMYVDQHKEVDYDVTNPRSHNSRNVTRYTSLDYTEHVHSFLIFDAIFLTCLTSTTQRV